MPNLGYAGVDLGTMQAAGAVPTLVRKTVTFTGAAGNGAAGTVALFTVTGDVEVVKYFEKCTESLVGAATLETGITGATAIFGPQVANATTVDAGMWNTSEGWATGYGADTKAGLSYVTAEDIFMTVGTTDITDGTVTAYLQYIPLSAGASVVAA